MVHHGTPFIRAAFGQQKMPAQRHKQYLPFVLIALASVEVYKGIKKQQRIKHYSIRGKKQTYTRGLARIVLFIIINSNVISRPPVTSAQQYHISEVIH